MTIVRFLYCLGILAIGMSSSRLGNALTISDLFFILSICGWLAFGFRGLMRRTVLVNAYTLGSLLVIAGACLALLRSQDVMGSVANIAKFAFVLGISFIQGPTLFRDLSGYVTVASVFAGSVILNFAGAIIQLRTGTNLFGVSAMSERLTGFSEHPNELGLHCALGVVVGILLARVAKKHYQRVLGVITVIAALLGVVLSASMTAIAAIAAAFLLVGIFELVHGRARLLIVGSFVLLVTAVVVLSVADVTADNFFVQRILRTQDSDLDDTTLGTRIHTYQVALERISENPIVGVGGSESDATLADGLQVHNIFLLALFEGGVLQFTGMLLIYAQCARMLWKERRAWEEHAGLLLFSGALFVVLFVSVSLAPVSIRRVAWIPFTLLLIPLYDGRTRLLRRGTPGGRVLVRSGIAAPRGAH